jgi:non-ribosomal peptide synthetase component F
LTIRSRLLEEVSNPIAPLNVIPCQFLNKYSRSLHLSVISWPLQVLLARYSGQDDIVVGVPVAGRDLPECQPLIGYFVNPVAVRCQIGSTTSLADAVQSASSAMTGALANSQLPLQEVVQELGVTRLPGVNPLYQVI